MRVTSNFHRSNFLRWNFLRWMSLCWALGVLLGTASLLADTLKGRAVSELQPIPAGVTLPVQLDRTLRSGKVKPGTVFTVTTTQRVPVSEETFLDRGAKLRGEVVTSTAGDGTAAHPAVLVIRFTQLSYRGQTVPIVTGAVAAASRLAVDDTFLPTNPSFDQFTSNPANWTTRQVGGQLVARAGWVGPVVAVGLRTVGSADYYGVYSLPLETDAVRFPRAIGIFSTTAEGMYGYEHGATLESSGGAITITSPERRAVIRAGEGLLLEIVGRR
jgi:hypothetical protein